MFALATLAVAAMGNSDTQYCNTIVVTKNDPESNVAFKLTTSNVVFKFGQKYSYDELFGSVYTTPEPELVFTTKNKTVFERYTVTRFYKLMEYKQEYKSDDITMKFSDCISFENFIVNIRNSIYYALPYESDKFMYSYSVFKNVDIDEDFTRDATLCGDNFTCIKNYCSYKIATKTKSWTYSPETQLCEYPKEGDTSVSFWTTANLFYNIQ